VLTQVKNRPFRSEEPGAVAKRKQTFYPSASAWISQWPGRMGDMTNGLLFLVLALLGAAGLLWWRGQALRRMALAKANSKNPYHCVTVRCRPDGCDAAKRISGKRYLSKDAPLIPLRTCSAKVCHCKYEHFEDRRREDRRTPYGHTVAHPPAHVAMERRRGVDRRKSRQREPHWVPTT
jgi:hypothetical protein